MLVRGLCAESLRELNVTALNQDPSPDAMMQMLRKFNLFVDGLNALKLALFEVRRNVYDMVADQVSYTIGIGADWDGPRPEEIIKAGFLDTAVNPTEPLETGMRVYTDEEWAAQVQKTLTGTIAWGLWYDKTFDDGTGYGTVFPFPIITGTGQIALYHKMPLEEVTEDVDGLNTALWLPSGYKRMLITNLAVDAADAFERTPSANLIDRAKESMTRVLRSNVRPGILRMPRALTARGRRGYNIITNGLND